MTEPQANTGSPMVANTDPGMVPGTAAPQALNDNALRARLEQVLDRVTKLEDQLSTANLALKLEKSERTAAERNRDQAQKDADGRWAELVEKHKELQRMRESKAEVAADRERWKNRAEKAEAITPAGFKEVQDTNERLRSEIAILHRSMNAMRLETFEDREEIKALKSKIAHSEHQRQLFEAAAMLMQEGRDAADKREAEAKATLKKVTAEAGELVTTITRLEAELVPSRITIAAIKSIHAKEHPKTIPFCAVCKALTPTPAVPAAEPVQAKVS